ncbi:hypothetical protein EDEG_03846 [Edhazardia aedis USNM 41457]|uniref:Uncharacterized protein n=1 Tax=Edhazardia aedis (strain USNM 41457) TaxID=1003232 RepID=J8ZPK8_EDHAE|nr:hypothetical protein EDEG_03846 [Edhazardia aedis USNM 41457]|eukprot:EJW01613.1 hypothetical protein EDEG_03846 [Edhazardia aedis USNM 41457]
MCDHSVDRDSNLLNDQNSTISQQTSLSSRDSSKTIWEKFLKFFKPNAAQTSEMEMVELKVITQKTSKSNRTLDAVIVEGSSSNAGGNNSKKQNDHKKIDDDQKIKKIRFSEGENEIETNDNLLSYGSNSGDDTNVPIANNSQQTDKESVVIRKPLKQMFNTFFDNIFNGSIICIGGLGIIIFFV